MAGADALSGLAALQAAHGSTSLVIAAEAAGGRHSAAAAALVCVPTGQRFGQRRAGQEVDAGVGVTLERWTAVPTRARNRDFAPRHRYRAYCQIVRQDIGHLGDVSQLYVSAPSTVDGHELRSALRGQGPTSAQTRIADADRGVAGPLARSSMPSCIVHPMVVDCSTPPVGSVGSRRTQRPCCGTAPFHLVRIRSRARARTVGIRGAQLSFPLESPFFVRNWASLLRLEAASCDECGYLALPPINVRYAELPRSQVDPQELPREGHVYASMENRFLPNGFPRPWSSS